MDIKFIMVNYEFIDKLEEVYDNLDLTLEHILILSIVNSFNKAGKNCKLSQGTFAKLCKCDKSTVKRRLNDLCKWGFITTWKPKLQHKSKDPNVTHLSKEVKQILQDLAGSQTGLRLNHNNKIIGDSESSLKDSSSRALQEFYKTLNF